MSQTIAQVDAFTDAPFEGNSAAVCILPKAANEPWMRKVAREMNLSETAFLHFGAQEDAYHLRWFTPAAEVDLCGHATLASAHYLWESGRLARSQTARFLTKSGLLTAVCELSGEIVLDFPARPVGQRLELASYAEALGATPLSAWSNGLDALVEFPDEATVRALRPDFGKLKRIDIRGAIVTAPASSSIGADFVSRFFAPAVGIDEDPVTGSAHCCLGPYWELRFGKSELVGRQVSERGGTVKVRRVGDRVHLIGRAVTVMLGELTPAACPV